MREPKPTCQHDVDPCALDCAKECTKGNNDVDLFERICLDGCMLFCEFVPRPSSAGERLGAKIFANSTKCTKGQLCP